MFSQDQVGEDYLGPHIFISTYLDNIYLSTGEAGGGGHDGGQERPLQQPRVGGRVRGQHPLHRAQAGQEQARYRGQTIVNV